MESRRMVLMNPFAKQKQVQAYRTDLWTQEGNKGVG